MLRRPAVIPLLLEACPSLHAPWSEYVASERDDEDLLYIDLSVVARHLVALAGAGGHEGELAAAFTVAERLQLEGDPMVREAVVIGLLEGVLCAASDASVAAERITRFLLPASATAWQDLDAFWARLGENQRRVA